MSRLLKSLEPLSQYKDRKFDGSLEEYVACLRRSTTVYVGNLAFHTTEEQIHELFSKCGPLKRIVMGLDKNQKTPCGFCFVEYGCRRDTEECVKYLNGARLDERDVRIDFDWCVCNRACQPRRLLVRCVPTSLTFRVVAQGISGGPTVRARQERRAGARRIPHGLRRRARRVRQARADGVVRAARGSGEAGGRRRARLQAGTR